MSSARADQSPRQALAIDAIVDAWCKEDHARALLPSDHEVVESTRTLRALIVEGIAGDLAERDLLHACWRLGQLMATRGGSPTLLGSTLDNAHAVTGGSPFGAESSQVAAAPKPHGSLDSHLWISMHAAASEGFAAARADLARLEAAAAWDYPSCVVRIDKESVAVAGGYPDDDLAAIEVWAGRVAQAVARAGFRRAFVSGRVEVCRALEDAFLLVGVERVPEFREEPTEARGRGARADRPFFSLWKRSQKER